MLFWAAVFRLICAVRRMETARPAESSDGEFTFEPEDKRASDWLNLVLDAPSRFAVVCADVFVLMTITTDSFHESPLAGLFCKYVASLPRGASFRGVRLLSCWPFKAASRRFSLLSIGRFC